VSTLHITNGDCAADTMRMFLRDPVLITCDPLHDGPAPRVDLAAWHRLRAQHLTEGEGSFEETRRQLEAADRTITDAARFDEVVLWFEHDLFDQLLLIRTLDLLSPVRLKPDTPYESTPHHSHVVSGFSRTRVSLICIDRFPGVEPFYGLGQLSAEQLATLTETRHDVTAEQFALATRAWNAFRAADPSELVALASSLKDNAAASATLPFLGAALFRFFEEYPSTHNGLSRTEQAVLRAADGGGRDAVGVFRRSQADEERPFLGDLGVFDIIHEFATATVPLVTVAADRQISLTQAGLDVLNGRADAVALNGIDVWRGGVHLVGRERSPWRWDARAQTLVS
jgi:hypothetical protein